MGTVYFPKFLRFEKMKGNSQRSDITAQKQRKTSQISCHGAVLAGNFWWKRRSMVFTNANLTNFCWKRCSMVFTNANLTNHMKHVINIGKEGAIINYMAQEPF